MTHKKLDKEQYFREALGISYDPYVSRSMCHDAQADNPPPPAMAGAEPNEVPGYVQDIDNAKAKADHDQYVQAWKESFIDESRDEVLHRMRQYIPLFVEWEMFLLYEGKDNDFALLATCRQCKWNGKMIIKRDLSLEKEPGAKGFEASQGYYMQMIWFAMDHQFLHDSDSFNNKQPIYCEKCDKITLHQPKITAKITATTVNSLDDNEPPKGLQLNMDELREDVEKYRPLLDKLKPHDERKSND